MVVLVAWRNFSRQYHRFQVILFSLAIGVAAMITLVGIVAGMASTLREKASRYFGGDLTVVTVGNQRTISGAMTIIRTIQNTPGFESLCWRSEYFGGDTTLFYNGDSIRQRKLIGVNWKVEAGFFRTLNWSSGGPLVPGDSQGVVVSSSTANRVKLKVGDVVTISLKDFRRNGNTMNLTVRGIFVDTSLFGYACYVDLDRLNSAMGYRSGTVTTLGVVLQPEQAVKEAGAFLVQALSRVMPVESLVTDRAQFLAILDSKSKTQRLIVTTLDANLADIEKILTALLAVSTAACGLFLLILMIGVANTYRMIVFERTQEIGTMRAMGLSRGRLLALFLTESAMLGAMSVVIGLLLGGALLAVASIPDWSSNSLMALFTENGHLNPRAPFLPLIALVAVLFLTTIVGAWIPVRRAVRMRPVDALREGE